MNTKPRGDAAIVAHYYNTPDIQQMADFVGDSLDIAEWIMENKPDRVVHASVRFMAETTKILNPDIEVILPDSGSTCSLVEQTNISDLRKWREHYSDFVHVAYINSSAEHKALADIIVTSRIVDDVIKNIYDQGKQVIFSPDRNMGEYLNYTYGYGMPVYSSVCDVHDKFKLEELELALREWTDGPKYIIAHPESPLPILKKADYVGSTRGMLNWIRDYPKNIGTIFVATEEGLLYNMRKERPELDIRQAPVYSGCACSVCPFMKLNTVEKVLQATKGVGTKIDYLSNEQMNKSRKPIERMLDFRETGVVDLTP